MPSYILHLTEASMVLKHLKKTGAFPISSEWEDRFLYGALLPDSVSRAEKQTSHFRSENANGGYFKTPDLDKFLQRYPEAIKHVSENPLLFGYYVHLHLDYKYYTEYVDQFLTAYDKAGRITRHIPDMDYAVVKKTGEKLPFMKIFTDEYLYGDYTRISSYFIEKFQLKIPFYQQEIVDEIRLPEVETGDMGMVLEGLMGYIEESQKANEELKVLDAGDVAKYMQKVAEEMFAMVMDVSVG